MMKLRENCKGKDILHITYNINLCAFKFDMLQGNTFDINIFQEPLQFNISHGYIQGENIRQQTKVKVPFKIVSKVHLKIFFLLNETY